jgi:hypothetical protein
MLSLGPKKSLSRLFGTSTASVLPGIQNLADKFSLQALDLYKKTKLDVDKELDKVWSLILIYSSATVFRRE